jgi:hypothetical protein
MSSPRRFPAPWSVEEFDARAELLGMSQRSPWGFIYFSET